MEIKKVDDALMIDLLGVAKETKPSTAAEDILQTQLSPQAVDSFDNDSFAELKLQITQAKEPGRDEYLAKIKSSIESGDYDIADDDLIEALFQDGFADALSSL
jgi:anti-sigma28 factor (negative regulator of flagellin synthesis)